MFLKRLFFGLFVLVSFSSAAYGQSLICERYSTKGDNMFTDKKARDSWIPPTLVLPINEFEEKPGSKSMHWKHIGSAVNQSRETTMRFRLLTNGKAVMTYSNITGATGRYKCDKKADEVRQLLASGNFQQTARYADASDKDVCGEVAIVLGEEGTTFGVTINNEDGTTQNQGWVDEAKRRWGNDYLSNCENIMRPSQVTDSTPTPLTTSKLDKAKSTCTELGFTLGTEKHGECVLKMMDN